jgi:hypothetical protein
MDWNCGRNSRAPALQGNPEFKLQSHQIKKASSPEAYLNRKEKKSQERAWFI